jgi:integrase
MSVLAEDWIACGIRERDWKPSTLSDNRSVVNARITPAFGARRPEKITADQIEDWRDTLVDERDISRPTANKSLIIFRAILEHGRKHGLVANRAREVPKLRERYDPNLTTSSRPTKSRRSSPMPAQTKTARSSASPPSPAHEWASCSRCAGATSTSMASPSTSTPPTRLGTLTSAEQVMATVKAQKRRLGRPSRDDLVYPGQRGEYLDGSALRRRYKKALEDAKLRPLRFHDLRHTFGTIAINQATIVQVQAWMGHADVQTTMRYMHHRNRAGDARLLSAAFRPAKAPKRRRTQRKSGAPKPLLSHDCFSIRTASAAAVASLGVPGSQPWRPVIRRSSSDRRPSSSPLPAEH